MTFYLKSGEPLFPHLCLVIPLVNIKKQTAHQFTKLDVSLKVWKMRVLNSVQTVQCTLYCTTEKSLKDNQSQMYFVLRVWELSAGWEGVVPEAHGYHTRTESQ